MGHSGAITLKKRQIVDLIMPCGLSKSFQSDKHTNIWMKLHLKNCKTCCEANLQVTYTESTVTAYRK